MTQQVFAKLHRSCMQLALLTLLNTKFISLQLAEARPLKNP
jgi:hypothetical protein